jgi:hypothetical protein
MRRERPPSLTREDPAWTPTRCTRCGARFRCGAGTSACWCDAIQLTAAQRDRLAELGLEGCLCRRCLEAL